MSDIRAYIDNSPSPGANKSVAGVRMTNVGQLFTANWVQELVLEGRVFSAHIGSLNAGADISEVTAGGNGTTIDTDQPEAIVGVSAGTILIPIEVHLNMQSDMDADADQMGAILFADLTQTVATTGVTATSPTVINHLGNAGETSVATVYTAVTADITDPVMSLLLDSTRAAVRDNGTAASAHLNQLRFDYMARVPFLMKGPASLVLAAGGTVATTVSGSVTWAEVPVGRYDVIQ